MPVSRAPGSFFVQKDRRDSSLCPPSSAWLVALPSSRARAGCTRDGRIPVSHVRCPGGISACISDLDKKKARNYQWRCLLASPGLSSCSSLQDSVGFSLLTTDPGPLFLMTSCQLLYDRMEGQQPSRPARFSRMFSPRSRSMVAQRLRGDPEIGRLPVYQRYHLPPPPTATASDRQR